MSVVMPRLFRTFQDAFFDTFYKQLTFFKRWFVVVVVFIWNVIPIRIERHDAETSVSQFIPNITITLMRKPHLVEKEYHMTLTKRKRYNWAILAKAAQLMEQMYMAHSPLN